MTHHLIGNFEVAKSQAAVPQHLVVKKQTNKKTIVHFINTSCTQRILFRGLYLKLNTWYFNFAQFGNLFASTISLLVRCFMSFAIHRTTLQALHRGLTY